MTAVQEALFGKADRALRTARANLEHGDADAAANRAYYAAYYAATAALLSVEETPKSHKGVQRRFYFHFVASGPLSPDVGGRLAYAQEVRRRADYEAFATFDRMAVEELLTDIEEFVHQVRDLIAG